MHRTLLMMRLALVALLVLPVTTRAAEPLRPVDVALMLAVDVSSSVDDEERRFQRLAYASALRDPRVIRAAFSGEHGRIVIGYMEWSGPQYQNVVVPLQPIGSAAQLAAFAAEIEAIADAGLAVSGYEYATYMGTTAMGSALLHAGDLLAAFQGIAKSTVIDISADGINNDGALIEEARDLLLDQGMTINGLPIALGETVSSGLSGTLTEGDARLEAYFAHCVVGGPGAFHVLARGWEDVEQALRSKLIMELAGGPATLPNPSKPLQTGSRVVPADFRLDLRTGTRAPRSRIDCASGMINPSRQSQ